MKAALVGLVLLTGCATVAPAPQVRNRDEAYMRAMSAYEVMLSQMVQYRDECFSRPPEFIDDCRPVVVRMRQIALDGMKYREVMTMAYHAGDNVTFDSSLDDLRIMQNALKNELYRQAVKDNAE